MKFKENDKAEVTRFNKWISEGETVTILHQVKKSVYLVSDANGDNWYIKSNCLTLIIK